MARREIRVFEIESVEPADMREELIMKFPAFIVQCFAEKATHQIKYDQLGAARFERDYGMTVREFCQKSFYGTDKRKYRKRKLNVSKSSDT